MTAREHRDELFAIINHNSAIIGQDYLEEPAVKRSLWLLVSIYSDPDESSRITEGNLMESEKEILRRNGRSFSESIVANHGIALSLSTELASRVFDAAFVIFRLEIIPLCYHRDEINLPDYLGSVAALCETFIDSHFNEAAARVAIEAQGFSEEKMQEMMQYCRRFEQNRLRCPTEADDVEKEYNLED